MKKMLLNTKMPPLAKAYGRESVPAPIQVVSRMKMEDTTVPLVALVKFLPSFPMQLGAWSFSITGSAIMEQ